MMDHHYSGSSIPSMRDNPVPNVGGTHVIIGDEKPLKMAPPRSWTAPSYSHEAPSRSPVSARHAGLPPSGGGFLARRPRRDPAAEHAHMIERVAYDRAFGRSSGALPPGAPGPMDAIRTAQAQAPRALGDLRRGPEARDAARRDARPMSSAQEAGLRAPPRRGKTDGLAGFHRGELDSPTARQAAALTEKVAMLEDQLARALSAHAELSRSVSRSRAESGRGGRSLDGEDGAPIETRNGGCQTDMPASADVEAREETDMQDFLEYVDASVTPVLNDLKEKTLEHQPLDVKRYLVLLLEESIREDAKAATSKSRRKKDS